VALARARTRSSPESQGSDFNLERPRIAMARTLWILGNPDQAVRTARETITGLEATEPVTACITLLWGASVFLWSGDSTSADECVDRVIPHAERHALTPYQHVAYGRKGEVLIQKGEIETGVELLRRSLMTLDSERMYAVDFCASLAQGLALMGRLDQALSTIEQAITRVQPCGELLLAELQRIVGELLEKTGDEQGAEKAFRRSIELADQQSALSWRLRTAISLAGLQSRQGRRGEASDGLADTYARFKEGFDTSDLKTARHLLTTLR
jgi:tetratricopeptide (TPR) repeat protein